MHRTELEYEHKRNEEHKTRVPHSDRPLKKKCKKKTFNKLTGKSNRNRISDALDDAKCGIDVCDKRLRSMVNDFFFFSFIEFSFYGAWPIVFTVNERVQMLDMPTGFKNRCALMK